MPVHGLDRVHRVADQVHVMNVTDRFGEARVVAHRHHALRAVQPAPALIRTERPRVEPAGEGAAEDLGQSRLRQQDFHRVPVDEYQPCIRIDRSDRLQREQVLGAFQHPAWPRAILVLQELQEALVKPVGGKIAGPHPHPASCDRTEHDSWYRIAGCGTHARRSRCTPAARLLPADAAGGIPEPAIRTPSTGVRPGRSFVPAFRRWATGYIVSHTAGARFAGSVSISRCRKVVPLRGNPVMKIGWRIGAAVISGHRAEASWISNRLDRKRTISHFVALRPTMLRADSVEHDSSSRVSGPMNEVSPKSLSPVCRRAIRISGSASSGRSSKPRKSATLSDSCRAVVMIVKV